MSWRKYLLLPQVIWHAIRAPRGDVAAWESYWGAVRDTGEAGDVLWDAGCGAEIRDALAWFRRYADVSLPVIDVGCGNGRRTRALAAHFPRAIGIDLSTQAVERAHREAKGSPNVTFGVLDATAPGVGRRLAAEVGESNVYIRGLLHVLDHRRRLSLIQNARQVLGRRGVVYYLETDFRGNLLEYMERLGARPGAFPDPLRRCLEYGLPRPRRFGARQHRAYFPERDWETLASGPAEVHTVPTHSAHRPEAIAGFFALVRPRTQPTQ